jgi:hypothetical protein
MSVSATAHIRTDRASVFLKQLCEHFADPSHRHSDQEFEVTFDDREGFIDFAPVISGTCRMEAREKELVVEATGTDQLALNRVQRLIARHLSRAAYEDRLDLEWSPAAVP